VIALSGISAVALSICKKITYPFAQPPGLGIRG
jgi:hypothetical protein